MKTEFDLEYYSHRQLWALVRKLTSWGWTVRIIAYAERRPPNELPSSDKAYGCHVGHDRERVKDARFGKTPWAALKAAVDEIITPYEQGGTIV